MIRRFAFLLLMLSSAVTFAQPGPQILWDRTYGDGEDAGIWSVTPTSGGAFVFTGQISHGNYSNRQIWMGKADEHGNLLWSREFGGTGRETGAYPGVVNTPDGGYALVGNTQSYGAGGWDFYLIKTNANGEQQWTRTYGGGGDEFAYALAACPTGGFILSGTTTSYGAGGSDAYLIRTNAQGDVLWTHAYGGNADEVEGHVEPTSDGGFVLVSATYSFGDFSRNILVVRADSLGNPLWTHVLGGAGHEYVYAVKQLHDGNFLVIGNGDTPCAPSRGGSYLAKLHADGTTEWERYYCGTTGPRSFLDAIQMPDGSILALGITGLQPYDGWLFRCDAQGNEIWSSSWGGPLFDWIVNGQLLPDGGVICAGFREVNTGYETNGFLLRLAPEQMPPSNHFHPVASTGLPYAIVVDSVRLDGGHLVEGDEIGVFDGDLCVGAGMAGHWPLSITAWQGDPEHNLPGFTSGHPMTFRLWVRQNEADLAATPTYSTGNGTFGEGAFSRLYLTASLNANLLIPLRANFANLISLNVRPPALNAATVFGGLSSLQAVYQDAGGVFIPPNINTIGEIHPTDAFRVYCTAPETLSTTGIPLSPQTEYTLDANRWHWISYPLGYPNPPSATLPPIVNSVIIVKDDEGRAWIPEEHVNTLGDLQPGRGYMFMMREPVTFHFDPSYVLPVLPIAPDWGDIQSVPPTGLPYNVVIHFGNEFRNNPPTTIEIYDGILRVGGVQGNIPTLQVPITTWQNAPQCNLHGFTEGHAIRIRLIGSDGQEIPSQIDGTPVFGSGGYADVTLHTTSSLPTTFAVGSVYPNPFNPTATLHIALSQAGKVEWRVYDVLGRAVFNRSYFFTAGDHELRLGREQLGVGAAGGIYLFEIRYDGHREVRKALLLK